MVAFAGNFYSVPWSYAAKEVTLLAGEREDRDFLQSPKDRFAS
jgi:hypothetical protein